MLVAGEINKQMNGKLKHIKRRRPFIDGYWHEDRTPPPPQPDTLYCWATLKWPKCEKDDSENGFQKGDCSISLYTGKSGNLKSRLTDCGKGFAKWQKIVLLADPVDEDEDENKQEQLNINALREAKNLNPSFVHCLNIKDEHKAHQINPMLKGIINNLIIEVKKLSNITKELSEICIQINNGIDIVRSTLEELNKDHTPDEINNIKLRFIDVWMKARPTSDYGIEMMPIIEERDGAFWMRVPVETFPRFGSFMHRKLIRLYKKFAEIDLPMNDKNNEAFLGWKSVAKCDLNGCEDFPNFRLLHMLTVSYFVAKRYRKRKMRDIEHQGNQVGNVRAWMSRRRGVPPEGVPWEEYHRVHPEKLKEELTLVEERKQEMIKKLNKHLKAIYDHDYCSWEKSYVLLRRYGWGGTNPMSDARGGTMSRDRHKTLDWIDFC
jgi:hypothetical protein